MSDPNGRKRRKAKKAKARKASQQKKAGREFEEAVFSFARSFNDPNFKVYFDHHVPDVRTGEPRQVDVWIELTLMGHVPFTIAVSCKDLGRRVDTPAIETFHALLDSYGASTGIIYSRVGYTKTALTLAGKLGIPCCVLWKDKPADQAGRRLIQYYWCTTAITHPQVTLGDSGFRPSTWDQLFDHRACVDGVERTVLEHIEDAFHRGEQMALEQHSSSTWKFAFPDVWTTVLDLEDPKESPTTITFGGTWRKFCGLLSANKLTGSFCASNQQLHGTETGPGIPVEGLPQPPEWEEIHVNPLRVGSIGATQVLCFTRAHTAVGKALSAALGGKALGTA